MACRAVAWNEIRVRNGGPVFALESYDAAASALHYVPSEGWWRRRESNPRPKTFHLSLYILIPDIEFRAISLLQAGY